MTCGRSCIKVLKKCQFTCILRLDKCSLTVLFPPLMTRSQLFTDAWRLACKGARRYGGSPRSYFACALRLAWRDRRKSPSTVKKVLALVARLCDNTVRHCRNALGIGPTARKGGRQLPP